MAGSVGSEDGDIGFQIAPMVDVVFVLMLFFMASAGVQVIEKELSINLPSGRSKASTRDVPRQPIVIDISPEGQVTMNNREYGTAADKNLMALREWFKGTLEQFGGDDPIIVRPAPDTKNGRIMEVLNAIAASRVTVDGKEVSFKNLTFG
jgi:biopolymer transport protein ExbD